MRVITSLTAAYIFIIAIMFSVVITSSDSMIGNVVFWEVAFSSPVVIAYILALAIRRAEARQVLLIFEIGYSIFTFLIILKTFLGEQDAQYQLALLLIPLFGFPGVIIAGVIAALSRKEGTS